MLRYFQWNNSNIANVCSLNSWLVVSQWAAPGSLAPPTLTHQHFLLAAPGFPTFFFFFEKADWKLPSYRGQRGRGQLLLLLVKTAAASPHCYCWTHSNNIGVYTVVVVEVAAAAVTDSSSSRWWRHGESLQEQGRRGREWERDGKTGGRKGRTESWRGGAETVWLEGNSIWV